MLYCLERKKLTGYLSTLYLIELNSFQGHSQTKILTEAISEKKTKQKKTLFFIFLCIASYTREPMLELVFKILFLPRQVPWFASYKLQCWF